MSGIGVTEAMVTGKPQGGANQITHQAEKFAKFAFGFSIDVERITRPDTAQRAIYGALEVVRRNQQQFPDVAPHYEQSAARLQQLLRTDRRSLVAALQAELPQIEREFSLVSANIFFHSVLGSAHLANLSGAEGGYWDAPVKTSTFVLAIHTAIAAIERRMTAVVKHAIEAPEDPLSARFAFFQNNQGAEMVGAELVGEVASRLGKAMNAVETVIRATLDRWDDLSKEERAHFGIRGDERQEAADTLGGGVGNYHRQLETEAAKLAQDIIMERESLRFPSQADRLLLEQPDIGVDAFMDEIRRFYLQAMRRSGLWEFDRHGKPTQATHRALERRMDNDILVQAYAAAIDIGYRYGSNINKSNREDMNQLLSSFGDYIAQGLSDAPIDQAIYATIRGNVRHFAGERAFKRLASYMVSNGYEFAGDLGASHAQALQRAADAILPPTIFFRLAIEYAERNEQDARPLRNQYFAIVAPILSEHFDRMERKKLVVRDEFPDPAVKDQWLNLFSSDCTLDYKDRVNDLAVSISANCDHWKCRSDIVVDDFMLYRMHEVAEQIFTSYPEEMAYGPHRIAIDTQEIAGLINQIRGAERGK